MPTLETAEDITLSHSNETLRRVKENDQTLKVLWIGGGVYKDQYMCAFIYIQDFFVKLHDDDGVFNPSNDSEFSSLGDHIAENTHLTTLVSVDGRVGLDVECLRRNSSIHKLDLICGGRDISAGAIHDILQVYQEKKNLSRLNIDHANLHNGGDNVLLNTLRGNPNLKTIIMRICGITGEQLLPIVEAIRGHHMLEELNLNGNNIGNIECEAIATLLDNPNCSIHTLNLLGNNIGNDGAITFANSLANNTTLQKLSLRANPFDSSAVEESFCKVLCNTSSISAVYSSNHALKSLDLPQHRNGDLLLSLLKLNEGTIKSHVAIKKILKHHPNINMEPMFEWDAEEGERNLKALPYVVDWFESAESVVKYDWSAYNKELYNEPAQETVVKDVEEERFIVEKRKLDAINQFARAMPLLFEGVSAM